MYQFGIVFLTQATNTNLLTDVVSLAKTTSSPAVWHFVIDLPSALQINNDLAGAQLNKIPEKCWKNPVDICCTSPEDPTKSRTWTVQFVCIDQMLESDFCAESQGDIPTDLFQFYQEVGQEDLRDDVDITLFFGTFTLEMSSRERLLCVKYGAMIRGRISDDEAHQMYSCFALQAGKQGYEMRRKDGSAGILTSQTDVNLLCLLPHLHSAIPRNLWSTYILRTKFSYLILYKRCHQTKPKQTEWTNVWYTPPHNGGKLHSLPKCFLEKFPCVGEFCYQKMLAVVVMDAVNKVREENLEQPVAVEEIQNELKMIEKSRKIYKESCNMLEFIHSYNLQNDFNQITHSVGNHLDYFPGGDGFENRMYIVHHLLKGCGRGGGLFVHDYVWAIVDWVKKK